METIFSLRSFTEQKSILVVEKHCSLKISKSQKKIMALSILPKKRTTTHSVSFVFWENRRRLNLLLRFVTFSQKVSILHHLKGSIRLHYSNIGRRVESAPRPVQIGFWNFAYQIVWPRRPFCQVMESAFVFRELDTEI